jgi:hypothetical protein
MSDRALPLPAGLQKFSTKWQMRLSQLRGESENRTVVQVLDPDPWLALSPNHCYQFCAVAQSISLQSAFPLCPRR